MWPAYIEFRASGLPGMTPLSPSPSERARAAAIGLLVLERREARGPLEPVQARQQILARARTSASAGLDSACRETVLIRGPAAGTVQAPGLGNGIDRTRVGGIALHGDHLVVSRLFPAPCGPVTVLPAMKQPISFFFDLVDFIAASIVGVTVTVLRITFRASGNSALRPPSPSGSRTSREGKKTADGLRPRTASRSTEQLRPSRRASTRQPEERVEASAVRSGGPRPPARPGPLRAHTPGRALLAAPTRGFLFAGRHGARAVMPGSLTVAHAAFTLAHPSFAFAEAPRVLA